MNPYKKNLVSLNARMLSSKIRLISEICLHLDAPCCLWKQFDCSVVVVDTVAPKGQVKDLTAFFTQIPEPEDFLLASEDFTPILSTVRSFPA